MATFEPSDSGGCCEQLKKGLYREYKFLMQDFRFSWWWRFHVEAFWILMLYSSVVGYQLLRWRQHGL
jgi:hypothetical protein